MANRFIALLQRTLLDRVDARLVRASWVDSSIREATLHRQRANELNAQANELNAQLAQANQHLRSVSAVQADLARAYKRLMSQYDELLDATERAKAENAALKMGLHTAESEADQWRRRCAQAEAGHAELTKKYEDAKEGLAQNLRYAASLSRVTADKLSEQVRAFGRLIQPQAVVGYGKVRIGDEHDGGYVMLDDLSRCTLAFSLGVGDNVSWDLDMAHRGAQVIQFDHTVSAPPIAHPSFRFQRRRIDAFASQEAEDLRSMRRFAHNISMISPILKIDIEHTEWDLLDHADPADLRIYSQIVCEFHWLDRAITPEWLARATRVIEKMSQDFQVIHVHGNNCAAYALVAGIPMPSVIEVTFCNRMQYTFKDSAELFPGPLDAPNNPAEPDLWLGSFRF